MGKLLQREAMMEWRAQYSLNGVLLYVFSGVFTTFMIFQQVTVEVWLALFWMISLFMAVNAMGVTFKPSAKLYEYQIASPGLFIMAKLIFNALFLLVNMLILQLLFFLLLGNPILQPVLWNLSILGGVISFSATITMVAGIASKAKNTSTLTAVLSFPLLIPQILLLISLSKATTLRTIGDNPFWNNFVALSSIAAIIITITLILFPYLWKD